MSIRAKNIIRKLILYICLLALMAVALFISSGKVRLVMGALTVAVLIFSIVINKLSERIRRTAVFAVVTICILLNAFYNVRNLGKLLPMSMTTNQMIYQEMNAEEKSLPDAYLRDLIKDKTIIVRNDVKTYDQYDEEEDEELRGNHFRRWYYVDNDYVRYFKEYSRNVEFDEEIPPYKGLTKFMNSFRESHQEVPYDLGYSNDMLRYSFILNKEGIQESGYFWYSWYYHTFSEEKERYLMIRIFNKEECENADRLCAIWDHLGRLTLMTEDYYKNTFRPSYDEYFNAMNQEVEK